MTWTDLNSIGVDAAWSNPVISGDGTTLFAKKANNVYVSLNSGTTWQAVSGVGLINFVSSDGDVIFASIADSGWDDPVRVTMSFDGGLSWQRSATLDQLGNDWRYGIISDDKQRIAIAPYLGSVTHSSDGGVTWGVQGSPFSTKNEWSEVATSIDGKTVYAVNWWTAGSIQKSTDGGVTWFPLENAGFRFWDNIATSGDGRVVVAAQGYTSSSGYIHISRDGGETWTTVLSDAHRNWGEIALSNDGQDIIAANGHDTGGLFVSHDGGQTWNNRALTPTARFTSVTISKDGTTAVAVQGLYNGGGMYTSHDGGDTWALQSSVGARTWSSVACSSNCSKMIATVDGGYFYVSSDGGTSWQEHQEQGIKRWSSIAVSADGQRMALAEYWTSSPVYLSDDGGQTWVQQTNTIPATDSWMDFAFSADGTVLYGVAGTYGIASDTGRVYRAKLHSLVPVVPSIDTTSFSLANRTIMGRGVVGSTAELTLPSGQVLSARVDYSGTFSFVIPVNVLLGSTLSLTQRSAAGVSSESVSFVLGAATRVLAPTGENMGWILRGIGILVGLSLATLYLMPLSKRIVYTRHR